MSDGNGGTDTGTMTVTVTPVNDPPVANNDTISMPEDTIDGALNLLGNDTDVDGDTLTVTAVTGAVNGTLTEQSPGVWTYTPDPDWNGTETLSYDISDGNGGTATATATVTVTPVNDPPVAGPDAYATTTLGILNVNAANGVLSNDSDVDGDTLTVTGDDSPTVTINADGSFTYIPVLPTTEVVHYTVSDGKGGTTTGTLTITVTLLPTSIIQLFMQPADTVTTGRSDDHAAGQRHRGLRPRRQPRAHDQVERPEADGDRPAQVPELELPGARRRCQFERADHDGPVVVARRTRPTRISTTPPGSMTATGSSGVR